MSCFFLHVRWKCFSFFYFSLTLDFNLYTQKCDKKPVKYKLFNSNSATISTHTTHNEGESDQFTLHVKHFMVPASQMWKCSAFPWEYLNPFNEFVITLRSGLLVGQNKYCEGVGLWVTNETISWFMQKIIGKCVQMKIIMRCSFFQKKKLNTRESNPFILMHES